MITEHELAGGSEKITGGKEWPAYVFSVKGNANRAAAGETFSTVGK